MTTEETTTTTTPCYPEQVEGTICGEIVSVGEPPVRLGPVEVVLPEGYCHTPPELIREVLLNYIPCDSITTTTYAEVGVPTPDVMQTLPSTGGEGFLASFALAFLLVGGVATWVARRG